MLAFVLLAAAIVAVWCPALPVGHGRRIGPWGVLFVAAIGAGMSAGVLTLPALAALAILAGACLLGARQGNALMSWVRTGAAGLLSLAMALHALPGFHNLVLLNAIRARADPLPFSLYANFDKASVGLLLLACLAPRCASMSEVRQVVKPLVWAVPCTVLAVMGLACWLGVVRFDPVWAGYTPTFLAVNLLFTCVAEEAFFRGLIQERLSRALGQRPGLIGHVPVLVSAPLFGLAHWGGGARYAMLASVAGLGYALVYARVRRVEASILVHFAVNAVHFVGFTYPALASSQLHLH
jgi:hypothetical protein